MASIVQGIVDIQSVGCNQMKTFQIFRSLLSSSRISLANSISTTWQRSGGCLIEGDIFERGVFHIIPPLFFSLLRLSQIPLRLNEVSKTKGNRTYFGTNFQLVQGGNRADERFPLVEQHLEYGPGQKIVLAHWSVPRWIGASFFLAEPPSVRWDLVFPIDCESMDSHRIAAAHLGKTWKGIWQ